MFSAYFDESGTLDRFNRVLVVGGFVSSVQKWARFESEWPEVLKAAGLPPGTIFHMHRFARNSPPYQDFAGDSARKAALISSLVGCVKRNVNKAFSCSVGLRDWERINARYCFAESLNYPYPLCGRTCVAQVMKWAQKKRGFIEFHFEKGATHNRQLKQLLKSNGDVKAKFESKEQKIQFQAADILAWKSRRVLAEVVEYVGPPDVDAYMSIQRSLAEIKSIPHSYGVHVYESLERLVQRANIARRTAIERKQANEKLDPR
jgi:hypothetical protein